MNGYQTTTIADDAVLDLGRGRRGRLSELVVEIARHGRRLSASPVRRVASMAVVATSVVNGSRRSGGDVESAEYEVDEQDPDQTPIDENDPDQVRERAEKLFALLPIWIRDPSSRGQKDPVLWWGGSAKPSEFDLMRLSERDFERYQRVVELTTRWFELQSDGASKPVDHSVAPGRP